MAFLNGDEKMKAELSEAIAYINERNRNARQEHAHDTEVKALQNTVTTEAENEGRGMPYLTERSGVAKAWNSIFNRGKSASSKDRKR